MEKEQIINHNNFENYMKINNIDFDTLNHITGVLKLDHMNDWGPDNKYFTPESISTIINDIQDKVIYKTNKNNNVLRLKRTRDNINKLTNNKIGKISSNLQKYIRQKNLNNENNIITILGKFDFFLK